MKKNVLFIVIDSVTNDILFNKNNSKLIAPFLSNLRDNAISGDNMYSEAPFTEAALMSLLCSVDTMDNGGYMEKFKNTKSVFKIFQENGYKVYFNNYYPSIYPSYMINGIDEKRYIEGFQFMHLWDYRFKYFSCLYLDDALSKKEKKMLEDMLDDNFKAWISYLEKVKNHDIETELINNNVDTINIEHDIKLIKKEYKKFINEKNSYLKKLFIEGEKHILFSIKNYVMDDKIHDDSFRDKVKSKYYKIFKNIGKLNFRRNLINNYLPVSKVIKSLLKRDFKTFKGLLAGYKNSLIDKDLYDRISGNYDLFKVQRSFDTVSKNFFKWLDNNKCEPWCSYIHIDDAHFPENFFSYDSNDMELLDEEFSRIDNYLKKLPKNYKGNITYDLSLLYCDNVIKNIFRYLEEKDILKDTAVVITADHGFSYYFSPVREKYVISSYKENYNVPFIIYSNDIEKKKIDGFCATKDIPATLLDLVNIEVPNYFRGKSLVSFTGRDFALLEYMGGGCPDIKRRPINLGVRTENYSVVLNLYISKSFSEKEIIEVYDLKNDKNEHINLRDKKNIEMKLVNELKILEDRFNELKRQYEKDGKND